MVRNWKGRPKTKDSLVIFRRWWWWTWITIMLAEKASMTTLMIFLTFYQKKTTQEMFFCIKIKLEDSKRFIVARRRGRVWKPELVLKVKKICFILSYSFYLRDWLCPKSLIYWLWQSDQCNAMLWVLELLHANKKMYKISQFNFYFFICLYKNILCRFWILFQNVHLHFWECFDLLYEAVIYSFEPNTTERSTGSRSR